MNEGDPVPAVLETLLAWGAYAFLASLAVLVLCLWLHRRAPDRFGFGRLGLLFFVPAVACVAVGWNAGRSAEGLFVLLTGCVFGGPALFCWACLLSAPYGTDRTGRPGDFLHRVSRLKKVINGGGRTGVCDCRETKGRGEVLSND